ncbi:MAG: TolC family protein [Elusimicrobia bacterium]|nr:TolC family protein [Elusimicrobiota bacterium]
MKIVRSAISNPYAVAVAAMMVLILGAVCLTRLPKDMLPVFKTPAVQILTFLDRAMEAHPEVAAAKSKLERAKANLVAGNGEDWPILSAVGSAGALSKTSLVPKQEWSAAVGIRLPLFEGFRISAAQQAAAAEIQLAEAELARIKISLSREIKNAYAIMEGSREKLAYLQEQLGHADRAYRLARRRYLEKSGALSDLRDAQTAYFQVSERDIGGRYEFYRAARKLKVLTGEGD